MRAVGAQPSPSKVTVRGGRRRAAGRRGVSPPPPPPDSPQAPAARREPRLTSASPAGVRKLLPPFSAPSVGVVPGLRGTAAGRAGGQGRVAGGAPAPRSPRGAGLGCRAGGCPAGSGWRGGCSVPLRCGVKGRPSGATGRRTARWLHL